MTCALSQQAFQLGVAPERGEVGNPLNDAQKEMSNFLSGLARSVSCPEATESGCGLRLPAVASRLERLREQLVEFEDVPYARVELRT